MRVIAIFLDTLPVLVQEEGDVQGRREANAKSFEQSTNNCRE